MVFFDIFFNFLVIFFSFLFNFKKNYISHNTSIRFSIFKQSVWLFEPSPYVRHAPLVVTVVRDHVSDTALLGGRL